eukprot:gb/GECG01007812.1/.p1 GENE.gb/GECG01007812.1/~~gb/GECG01007812.1/.p1  ORF type:complete len:108 (+),score=2.00 gb/GECG01007812.1/:1-324(+)
MNICCTDSALRGNMMHAMPVLPSVGRVHKSMPPIPHKIRYKHESEKDRGHKIPMCPPPIGHVDVCHLPDRVDEEDGDERPDDQLVIEDEWNHFQLLIPKWLQRMPRR